MLAVGAVVLLALARIQAVLLPEQSWLLPEPWLLAAGLAPVLAWKAYESWRSWVWAQDPQGGGCRRVVLVTGAASGLGRGVVLRCLARGDSVVALDIDISGLQALRKKAPAFGCGSASVGGHHQPKLVTVGCDVGDAAAVAKAVEQVRKELGQGKTIDVIACFAGLIRSGPLLSMPPSELAVVMQVNVEGTHRVIHAFSSLLRTSPPLTQHLRSAASCNGSSMPPGASAVIPSPKIIIVCSELSLAWMSPAFSAPYSMSKFALEAYAASLRLELSLLSAPIPVVVLNPGAMATPMLSAQRSGGANSFAELARTARQHDGGGGGGVFAPFLRRAAGLADGYIARNTHEPALVADVVEEIVHAQAPRARYVIGASFEMRYLVPYVPQWLLDITTRHMLQRESAVRCGP